MVNYSLEIVNFPLIINVFACFGAATIQNETLQIQLAIHSELDAFNSVT